MGPNGGSVAMDSGQLCTFHSKGGCFTHVHCTMYCTVTPPNQIPPFKQIYVHTHSQILIIFWLDFKQAFALGSTYFKKCVSMRNNLVCSFHTVVKFSVPDWGIYYIVDSHGIGLLYRPASLGSLAGRCDNPMPESTKSSQSWTKNLATGLQSAYF